MADTEPTPDGRYDGRVYLPQDADDGTSGLAFRDHKRVVSELCVALLPDSVRTWRQRYRLSWGQYVERTRAWMDALRRDPPLVVLEDLADSLDLSAEEQRSWRYSDRANAALAQKRDAIRAAYLRTLPAHAIHDLAELSGEELQEAQDAIAIAYGIEQHLGPDGANSFFSGRCGETVDQMVARGLRTLAMRRDDLSRQGLAALSALKRHIAAHRTSSTALPVLRPDVDSMEEAVFEAAANRGPRRSIRPALLKPHMNRGGDWVEGKTPDGKDVLRAMPVTDAKGRSPQRPGSEFEIDPEIGADFLDGQTEDVDMRPVVRAFGCPADRAMAAERDAEIHAVEEHFRGLSDMAALACLDYLLERKGRQTRDDAAAFYGVSASQVRSAERRVLSELEPRLRRFVERPRDGTAAG